jgi:hypothetical protein
MLSNSLVLVCLLGLIKSAMSDYSSQIQLTDVAHVPLNFPDINDAIFHLNGPEPSFDNSILATFSQFSAQKYIEAIADGLTNNLNIPLPNISQTCLNQFMHFSNHLRNNQSQWAIEGYLIFQKCFH